MITIALTSYPNNLSTCFQSWWKETEIITAIQKDSCDVDVGLQSELDRLEIGLLKKGLKWTTGAKPELSSFFSTIILKLEGMSGVTIMVLSMEMDTIMGIRMTFQTEKSIKCDFCLGIYLFELFYCNPFWVLIPCSIKKEFHKIISNNWIINQIIINQIQINFTKYKSI